MDAADLTVDEAGLLLAQAVQIMGTLEAVGAHVRPDSEPLPRGMLTCGEACRLVPAVIALTLPLPGCQWARRRGRGGGTAERRRCAGLLAILYWF